MVKIYGSCLTSSSLLALYLQTFGDWAVITRLQLCAHARTHTQRQTWASSLLCSPLLIESQACSLWLALSLEVCWSQQPGGIGLNIPLCAIPRPFNWDFSHSACFSRHQKSSARAWLVLARIKLACFLPLLLRRFPFLTFHKMAFNGCLPAVQMDPLDLTSMFLLFL